VSKKGPKFATGHTVGDTSLARIKTILLVDDDFDALLITKWFLGSMGYLVHSFSNAEEALSQFDPKIHDLVITDNSMSRMTGEEMAHIIKLRSPSTPVLMHTGVPPANRSCLDGLVEKPTPLPMLKEAIDKLLAAGG
jgi:DNA-binding NtrC family response regulator